MYINNHFRIDDVSVLHRVVNDARFGLLVSGGDLLTATHIPFVLHPEHGELGALIAHTPRADRISRQFDGETDMLAVFTGPVAYVSPTWYEELGLPTYNFVAVHAYGRPRGIDSREQVLAHLRELVNIHEHANGTAASLDDAPPGYIDALLPHIAAFELVIERLEGKLKLSQNKSRSDRDGVIHGLHERGHEHDVAIAELMDDFAYASDEGRPILPDLSTAGSPYQSR